MVIEVPNPRPGFVYGEAACKATHPSNLRAFQKRGYRKVDAREAIKDLGFEDRSVSDGGFIDKTNNAVTNGDVLLVEIPVATYVEYRNQRDQFITQKGHRIDDEYKQEVEKAVGRPKETIDIGS